MSESAEKLESQREYHRRWREQNRDKVNEYARKYAKSERRKAWLKEYDEKNKEKLRAKRREWESKREEHIKRTNAEWHQRNRDRRTDAYLRRTYGISLEQYHAMLAAQGGGCAVCGVQAAPGWRLPVDHCHKTGKVRGILCTRCNISLGRFGDDESLLRKLADYVEGSR